MEWCRMPTLKQAIPFQVVPCVWSSPSHLVDESFQMSPCGHAAKEMTAMPVVTAVIVARPLTMISPPVRKNHYNGELSLLEDVHDFRIDLWHTEDLIQ